MINAFGHVSERISLIHLELVMQFRLERNASMHMQTKSTRYNDVGSGILHLLMHSAVAGVSGEGRKPLAVSSEHKIRYFFVPL